MEADDTPLLFTAPSRRQAMLWVTALEVCAAYAEANVEDVEETAANVGTAACRSSVLGMLEPYLEPRVASRVLLVARTARLGMLEPYLMGPEAARRWEKRRVKWIFDFADMEGAGGLELAKVKTILRDMNINDAEGQEVFTKFLREAREGRRAGGGRQIRGGRLIHLADFRRMLQFVDGNYARAVRGCLNGLAAGGPGGPDDGLSAEDLSRFLVEVQQVRPAPSMGQVQRLMASLSPPLVTRGRCLSSVGLAHLLCSPGNALVDPAKRGVFQDMTQPLSSYFIESSHNTYLEGNQLSSRSSVLRYVEVLRTGCRSVEVDVWDGPEGEPVVKHGYTVTTEVLFEDVVQAIADHAFVASEYPVIISVEQHCSSLQRVRQGEVLMKVLGDRLLMPPWDEDRNDIDFGKMAQISPWSARRRFLVKSERGCCERCRSPLPTYDRCIALPTMKLLRQEKDELNRGLAERTEQSVSRSSAEAGRHSCHVASMTAGKVLKIRQTAGERALCLWNTQYLMRAYPEGTRIGSGNVDPVPLWSNGVQMVALNYQTPDTAMLLNEGLFQSYNGGCGYVLKPAELRGLRCGARPRRRGARLRLRICCGYRLPRPEAHISDSAEGGAAVQGCAVSSPFLVVTLEPSGQVSQTPAVMHDGYHPIFNHEINFVVPDTPFHVLTFEVRDAPTARPMARRAVALDAIREGFRWLALRSTGGNMIPHGGLLVRAEFLPP